VLQPGDLLFQDLDCGPFCDAIEKVTTGYQGTSLSHVGIVAKDNDGNFIVIEALLTGVGVTPLDVFLNRSLDTKYRPKVAVGRLKQEYRHLIPVALEQAFALDGRPYDKVSWSHFTFPGLNYRSCIWQFNKRKWGTLSRLACLPAGRQYA